mgnify:CR=1 FL=1
MIVDLIKSSNIHTIEMPKENDGYNYVQFDEKKAEDDIAQGSKVVMPQIKEIPKVRKNVHLGSVLPMS